MKNNAFTVDLDPLRNRFEVVSGIALSPDGELTQSYVRIGDGTYTAPSVPQSSSGTKPKARRSKEVVIVQPVIRDVVELVPVLKAEGPRLTFCTPVLVNDELALTTHQNPIQPENRAIVRLRIPGGSLGGSTEWHVRDQAGLVQKPELMLTQKMLREQKKMPAGRSKVLVELAWGDVVSAHEPFIEYLFAIPQHLTLVVTRSGNVSPEAYRKVAVQWDGKNLDVKFLVRAVASTKKREPQTTV